MIKNIEEIIKTEHEKYKTIGSVFCPAFKNERVYFTIHGFNHLIRKRRHYRNKFQQLRRLGLLKYVTKIVSDSNKFIDYRVGTDTNN